MRNKGFAHIILVVIVLVVAIGGIAFSALSKSGERNPKGGTAFERAQHTDCKQEFVKFGASPLRVEDIDYLVPMGRMSGEHVNPTDHQYFHPPAWNAEPKARDVIAPGDGFITIIERLNFESYPGETKATDHHVFIEHSCNVTSIYTHITNLSDRVSGLAGDIKPGNTKTVRIPVTQGEVIGTIRGFADSNIYQLDFSVIDTNTTLSGLLDPSFYESEWWKIHIVDPFDYFQESVVNSLLSKNLRSSAPLGGKIDYDVDGKLVGNWFEEGYAGFTETNTRYWEQHLSFAYDHIDPTQIRISIGDYKPRSEQFGVVNNSPDPATIGVGIQTKYELAGFGYFNESGERWDRVSYDKNLKGETFDQTEGVMLVELVQDRKLKVEVFPGKTGDQITGFTSAAKIFVR